MKKRKYISAFKVSDDDHFVVKAIKYSLDHLMGLPKLFTLLEDFHLTYKSESDCFFEKISSYFSWQFTIKGTQNLKGNENKGGLVIYCNHPHGIADIGIVGEFCTKVLKRNNLLFVSNSIIKSVIPVLGERSICVDNMSKKSLERQTENQKSFDEMKNHLKDGGALCIFPAGEVSHVRFRSPEGSFLCTDSAWKNGVKKLKEETDAVFLPFYIHGKNSSTYLFLRFFSKTFGRLLNFREFISSKETRFTAQIRPRINSEIELYELRASLFDNSKASE